MNARFGRDRAVAADHLAVCPLIEITAVGAVVDDHGVEQTGKTGGDECLVFLCGNRQVDAGHP